MKKIIIILLTLLLLASCRKALQKQTTLEISFADYFGYSLTDYLNETNISADTYTEVHQGTGFYTSTNTVTFESVEYTPFLLVDGVAGVIYGGGYQAIINNPDEKVWFQVNELKRFLVNEYGEPSTYEGLDNILSNMRSFSDLKEIGNAIERWTIEREISLEIPSYEGVDLVEEIELSISYMGETAMLQITQRIRALR